MPTQQTILEIEFADSESDSDDEIVEKNPPKQVLEEPPKKRLDDQVLNSIILILQFLLFFHSNPKKNDIVLSIWELGLQYLSYWELLIWRFKGRTEKKWGAHYFLR